MQLTPISAIILYISIVIGIYFKPNLFEILENIQNVKSSDLWNQSIKFIQSSLLSTITINSILRISLFFVPIPFIYWTFKPYSKHYKPLEKLARKKKSGFHVPPVYPNGWFKAIASKDLPNKGSITSLRFEKFPLFMLYYIIILYI